MGGWDWKAAVLDELHKKRPHRAVAILRRQPAYEQRKFFKAHGLDLLIDASISGEADKFDAQSIAQMAKFVHPKDAGV